MSPPPGATPPPAGDPAPSSDDGRLVAAAGLRVQHFDDEAVVFHPLSWDAHLLNPAACAILDLLLESPRSEDEIAAFLAEALQPDEQGRAADHARRLIAELQSLGLVERT